MANQTGTINRRAFLKGAAAMGASLALPTIIPASARGADGHVAPSNRIVMGCIGVKNQGTNDMKGFLNFPDVQVVAVCDVDRNVMETAQALVNRTYGTKGCAGLRDFRELNARPDIDCSLIVTPDHWHTLVALDAMRNGKDCYVEKPLTLTIEEGIVLREAARRYGRVVQTGSQQRSADNFRYACELVRNGRLGKIDRVEVGIPANNRFNTAWQPMPVPEELDYDMWLGQAPWEPYTVDRCHYTFRFIRDYSGGQVTNWGAHHIDIAQWGLGMDDSGPVEVYGKGEYPQDGLFNTASKVYFECTYASGARLIVQTRGSEDAPSGSARGQKKFSGGTTFYGEKGMLHVDRGQLQSDPASLIREPIGPEEINLYRSRDHYHNFIDCIRTRQTPIASVEIGHRSATVCHLGNIAMLLGRKLKWDPQAERFIGDEEAQSQCSRAMREPWSLKA